jgi:hypothetical protein
MIFLVSAAMLSAEVTVTRLLSYKFYFHFVFLVISLAQLGIAGAGAWLFVLGKRAAVQKSFTWGLLGIAAFCVLFLFGYAWLSPQPNLGLTKVKGDTAVAYLIALSVLLVALYFCAGVVYAALFSRHKSRFNQLYASDLMGASLGCIASIGLMWLLGPVKTFLISGLLSVFAAALAITTRERSTLQTVISAGAVALFGIAIVAAWFNAQLFDPNARYDFPSIIEYEWNHLARTDRVGPGHYIIDGDASTWVIDPQSDIEYLVAPPNPDVAIIGVGAGPQLRSALTFAPNSVLAVDINPSIINWSVGKDSESNGHIFNQPQVIAKIDEGRHAVRASDRSFDVIVMHAVDTYAASSSGAYSLSENYLYTVEAFRDFYAKLSPQGLLAMRRWLFYPPRENLRLFTTIHQALTEEGIANPEEHMIVLAPVEDFRRVDLKEWGYILFSKQPFSEYQLDIVDQYVVDNQWSYLHRPGKRFDTAFSDFVYSDDRELFYRDYPYFVRPCYDANPFFFQFVPPFAALYKEAATSASVLYNQSTDLLFVTLLIVAVLTLFLLALPVYLRREKIRSARQRMGVSTLYFACLGVGFMAVELATIQIMTLFLGHPAYALSIALLGMLAFAGMGSMILQRLPAKRARGICLVIGVLSIVAAVGLLPFIHTLISAPFWVRMVVTLIWLALLGVPLGMPMATGIRLIGSENKPQVAWAWACNGGAAVVGTNLCMILMVYFGVPIVLLVGAACYFLAHLALSRMYRSRNSQAVEQEGIAA